MSSLTKVRSFLFFTAILFIITIVKYDQISAQASDDPANDAEIIKKALRSVHFGDLVDIDVVGSFEYDWRGTLTPEGLLDGPDKLGLELNALCLSEEQLAAEIAKQYSRLLRDPTVIVKIIDTSKRPAALMNGAVKNPHRFQIRRPVRINELIVAAGGLFDTLSGEISIFRPPDTSCFTKNTTDNPIPRIISIKISDLLKGELGSNPYILPGDIVTVLDAKPIYVIGGVRNPRTIPSRTEVTLSRAVSAAGGISRNGVEGTIVIFRREDGEVTRIEADLAAINAGKAEDINLKEFDIVDVAVRGSAAREFPPVIENERLYANPNANIPTRIID